MEDIIMSLVINTIYFRVIQSIHPGEVTYL